MRVLQVGWLDGYASPKFVGKYELGTEATEQPPLRGRRGAVSPLQLKLMGYSQQTLQDTSIERQADGTLLMSFTATLGADGFPASQLSFR